MAGSLCNNRARYPLVALGLLFIYLITASTKTGAFGSIHPATHGGGSKSSPVDANEDVAFCIATKDHPDDLIEFLVHHYHHHGIRRFYIMDDGSATPLSSFKDYGIPRSHLSFQYFDEKSKVEKMQTHIYSECIRLYGPNHKWMAFVDADEFFETLREGETLLTILQELYPITTIGALGVNWRLHSSSGIIHKASSVRKSFTSCCADPVGLDIPPGWKDSRLIKSIVKTDMFDAPISPHMFGLKNNTKTVGEHQDVINEGIGVRVPITKDRIALHHYTLKSREQFEAKLKTWQAKDWSYWDHIEGLPQTECREMTKYNP
ncbi:hypothetical protein V502_07602 [Pseudogymnoascus sp. VKM F-4520 (FW-2644)]|nr:hypothetical protein V502_07602 [Pseudogymnoascus sp. VKM F-4520 (FW-2644)]